MKWKYAWKEAAMHPVMMLLIFVQTVVVFIVLISMISVITSRYDKYNSIEGLLEGRGQVGELIFLNKSDKEQSDLIQSSSLAEKYLSKVEVSACYDWEFEINGNSQDVIMTGYDDEMWECYSPELEDGRWFQEKDLDVNVMEVVIAQKDGLNGKYQVGDRITAAPELVERSLAKVEQKPMELEVIGIIADGASVLGIKDSTVDTDDYRSLFWNYSDDYEEKIYIMGIQSDFYHYKMNYALSWFTKMGGLTFFSWQTDESDVISKNQSYLMENGMYGSVKDFEQVRQSSLEYVFEQIKTVLPILLTLILLTALSTVSNTAILLRQNIRNYAIYYINGLTWKECVFVHLRNILLTELGILLITLAGVEFCDFMGWFNHTVISIGGWQLLGCAGVVFLYVLSSVLVTYQQIGKKTAKDVLREA